MIAAGLAHMTGFALYAGDRGHKLFLEHVVTARTAQKPRAFVIFKAHAAHLANLLHRRRRGAEQPVDYGVFGYLFKLAVLIFIAAVAQMQDRIVTLDRYAPWKSFVVDSDALFVVSPSQRGGFSAQAVPMSQQDNTLRLPFPESWAGKSADELQSLTGIATLRFCHNNRFLISADTKEDAIAACHLTMKE